MKYFSLLLCCALCFSAIPNLAEAKGVSTDRQSATIANFSATQNDSLAGIHGIRLDFDVLMKYRGDALIQEGETSIPYNVVARFYDEFGEPLSANSDAAAYLGPGGQLQDSARIMQGKFHQEFRQRSIFVPWYAMALLPGQRKVKIRLEVYDDRKKELVGQSDFHNLTFEMPVLSRFRMEMKRIEVTEKDLKTDSWDYYFLNKREVLPDVRWSLMRGRHFLILTDKQKNSAVYEGDPEKDRTIWFTLAQGDQVRLTVQDFDLITFSDEIGTLMLDPWSAQFGSEELTEIAFGQVLSARFQLRRLDEPKLLISNFELLEGQREGGVTGMRLRFNYQLDYDIVGVRFRARLEQLLPDSTMVPRFARVVSGPAQHEEGADFRLTSNSGEVVIFVPWYGLAAVDKNAPLGQMRLSGEWRLDGQRFQMAQRRRELLNRYNSVKDVVFGQWTAGEVIRDGIAGLLFSCEYQVSGQYQRDLPAAVLRLYPEMRMQEGPVPPGYLQRIAPKNAQWQDDALILTPQVDTSRLDLFMPYYMLPRDLPNLQLDLSYHAELGLGEEERSLGGFELMQEIELPRRISMRIGVIEAGAKKERRLFRNASLEWRVYQGNMEKYRSRPIPHDKTVLEWRPDEVAELVLTEKDLVRVEVYRVVGEGEPTRLGAWEGELQDLPVPQKGKYKLEVEELKKLVISVDELDD